SGLGHLPVFTGIVELAGITFTGEPAKNKKQAEKNAAMAAWSSLKQCAEGPDHAPRFKALVNFNGDSFESPNYFTTLRQAEHAAAEVALSSLSSHSLAARILIKDARKTKSSITYSSI
nr:double-stranded RNA-binding protein 2-like [Tanacetum cinerariifolium]